MSNKLKKLFLLTFLFESNSTNNKNVVIIEASFGGILLTGVLIKKYSNKKNNTTENVSTTDNKNEDINNNKSKIKLPTNEKIKEPNNESKPSNNPDNISPVINKQKKPVQSTLSNKTPNTKLVGDINKETEQIMENSLKQSAKFKEECEKLLQSCKKNLEEYKKNQNSYNSDSKNFLKIKIQINPSLKNLNFILDEYKLLFSKPLEKELIELYNKNINMNSNELKKKNNDYNKQIIDHEKKLETIHDEYIEKLNKIIIEFNQLLKLKQISKNKK